MENNVYFECYDPYRGQAKLVTLELKGAIQIQFDKGQINKNPECMFFPNQILAVEGSYERDTATFECKHVYQGDLLKSDISNINNRTFFFGGSDF